jgi:hypothetical protein
MAWKKPVAGGGHDEAIDSSNSELESPHDLNRRSTIDTRGSMPRSMQLRSGSPNT